MSSTRKSAKRRTRTASPRRRQHRSRRPSPLAPPARGPAGPSCPDPYLPNLSVADADWLRAHMVRIVARRLPGARLNSPASIHLPHGGQMSLLRASRMLAATERGLWPEALEHHASVLMTSMNPDGTPRALEDYEDEDLLSAVHLRLVPSSRTMVAEVDEPEMVPGIRLTHVLDLGGLLMTVPSTMLHERLSPEAIEPAALSNTRRVMDRVHHSEPGGRGLHVIESETMLTAALSLHLGELCERFRIPRPRLGHVVALPEQERLVIMPIDESDDSDDSAGPSAFHRMATRAVECYDEAEHPLSPVCYHVSHEGVWTALTEVHGSMLALVPGMDEELAAALGIEELWGVCADEADDAGNADDADGAPMPDPPLRPFSGVSGPAAEYGEAVHDLYYERLADFIAEQGEALTEQTLDEFLDTPMDVIVPDRSSMRARRTGPAPAPWEETMERIAAMGPVGQWALLHLASRQFADAGIEGAGSLAELKEAARRGELPGLFNRSGRGRSFGL
ncbi:hypothetical protein ACSL103130_11660 [Actinomyces slackii]|uniref:Uncharacterized protein n=1 Tax=Actinomyces slackii TaxID=52774 RepID=A0A3S4TAQ8_9ACTO|nr:hypothetical protein [Actinomyces slackii]VEG73493.1 Uncharacterised protein [Actinomyces slackii]